jgi:hypothetical protein
MTTLKSCWEIVSLKHYSIICYVVVKVDNFVVLKELEWILNQITLVSFELHVGYFHSVYKANDVIEKLVFSLVEYVQVNGPINTGSTWYSVYTGHQYSSSYDKESVCRLL